MRFVRFIFASVLIIAPLWGLHWYLTENNISYTDIFTTSTIVVRIGDAKLRTEVVDSPESMKKGLSGRDSLEPNDAMLFVFPESDRHGIWMKDMKFSLDILWVSEDFRVVTLESNVNPDTYPRTFRPSEPARYVIEMTAGTADLLRIGPGDLVSFPKGFVATN